MEYPATPDLYPIVQDLTEAEYDNQNCCCTDTFGNFSLGELVIPRTEPRSLPMTPRSKQGHKRGNSLFNFSVNSPKSVQDEIDTKKHRRTHSSPTKISGGSVRRSLSAESEERVTGSMKFEDTFVLTRQIYRCNVSSLWECVNREEGTRHCVKIIDRRRFSSSEDEESALKEIAMMTFLKSYNSTQLAQVVQVTEDLHHFYIVMALAEGTNLANSLQEGGGAIMTESEVQRLARSLLKAVQQMHDLGVCHYDLQPENILLQHNRKGEVVLCDFGSARFVNGEDNVAQEKRRHRHRRSRSLRSILGGNLNYAAPETIAKHMCALTLASDMWSVGVILYQCLCGSLPFDEFVRSSMSSSGSSATTASSSRGRLKENIIKANYSFWRKEWSFVTRGAKQFVSSLLHPDPTVRLTVSEALSHPWLSMSPPLLVSPSPTTKSKRKRRSLVKRVLGTIAKRNSSTVEKIDDLSKDFDLNTASTLSSLGSMEESMRRQMCV